MGKPTRSSRADSRTASLAGKVAEIAMTAGSSRTTPTDRLLLDLQVENA
jgi:hypothetical protein